MTITREIDGKTVEIELTVEELSKAYFEKQAGWDREDIEMLFEDYSDCPEQFAADYGVEFSEAKDNIDFIAEMLRENMDNYEVDYASAREQALDDWIATRTAEGSGRGSLEYVGGGDYEETAE